MQGVTLNGGVLWLEFVSGHAWNISGLVSRSIWRDEEWTVRT